MSVTRWCLLLAWCALIALGTLPAARSAPAPTAPPVTITAAEYQVISGPTSPRVAFALRKTTGLVLAVEVASLQADGSGTRLTVGLAATKAVILTDGDAVITRGKSLARYIFTIPANALVTKDEEWARLRMGVAVAWEGGPYGGERQRERFRHLGFGASHRELSTNTQDWAPLDITEYARTVADTRNRIAIPFTQPMDGKATVVVEDAAGNRIRNLISGKPLAKGAHTLEWDGTDDQGRVVPPGAYRWRAASHPGIRPRYQFAFCNDPGPNHTCLNNATTAGDWVFFGAPVTEGGYAIMALDSTGKLQKPYSPIMGTGIERVALAAEGEYLYAAHDGVPWGKDSGPSLSITRFNIKNGNTVDYPGGKRYMTLKQWEKHDAAGLDLGGLAALDGKLYLASRLTNNILVLDAKTCEKVREIALPAPGTLTVAGGKLYAVSGRQIVSLDPASGQSTAIVTDETLDPQGLAVSADGRCYVSDGRTSTVRVYNAQGKLDKTLGKPGGAYAGAYDAERMVNPRGLTLAPNGWLWVTEERWTPKRLVAWDPTTGKVAKEQFGPTNYGAGGGGFDTADQTRWIGMGAQWKLDIAKKTAVPTSVLGSRFPAMHYAYLHQDGRTFLIGFDGFTTISELLPDGSAKALAFIGSTHRFCYNLGWNPPPPFIEAFNKAHPTRIGKHGDKGPGVLWVDRNGDGDMQVEEFDFSTAVDDFAGAYWGHDQRDLTLRLPATVKGQRVLVTLTPDGFYPGGAPKYPTLNTACLAGVPIGLDTNQVETTVDRFGNILVNSDPYMTCFSPAGKLLWTYPNRWTNVHGSHAAPLPEVGMMQGALFFLGVAPLDAQSDVFMMNGNHGRFFVLTSDGLYLDEMFKDVRLGGSWDEYMIGGECFGGFFGKSAKDGNYYLQSGSIEYRVYQIDGIDKLVRSQGALTVTPAQIAAAERNLARRVAASTPPRTAMLSSLPAAPVIDGKEDDWPATPTVQWDKSGQFPVIARAAYDATHLYLHYTVNDPSPWVNGGTDWTLLFKTGDSVDLQLGTNAAANPQRSVPVPGDLRLLIAPFQGKATAVLYRHRVPGSTNPATFISPWRSEKVDVVRILENARVTVLVERGRYRLEAAIPLADLAWTPHADSRLQADFGALFGDPEGKATMLRSYWSNQATNLVNDVPGEIMLSPNLWGALTIAGEEDR